MSQEYAVVDETRSPPPRLAEEFDRVEFAMRALRVLRPRKMTVAVYQQRHDNFRVERVRNLRAGDGATWTSFGIPRGASRAQIAYALAELAGAENSPFVVDVLIAAGAAVSASATTS